MITYVNGDLLLSPAKVLVNPVNLAGMMGKGLSGDFRRLYPEMAERYRQLCDNGTFQHRNLYLYRTPHKWILNFPVKQHWRSNITLDMLEAGLQKFAGIYAEQRITSISFPMLSEGAVNLHWDTEVRPLMESYLDALPLNVYIHVSQQDQPRNMRAISARLSSVPQEIPFEKFWRDLSRVISSTTHFETEDGATFEIVPERRRGRRSGRSLTIEREHESVYLSESLLSDLWIALRAAGYLLPDNLPGGLEQHADALVPLLSRLDYIKPVELGNSEEAMLLGLHYLSPARRTPVRSDGLQEMTQAQPDSEKSHDE